MNRDDAVRRMYRETLTLGVGLVFGNFAIGTAERIGANLAQEFILSRFTRRARHQE